MAWRGRVRTRHGGAYLSDTSRTWTGRDAPWKLGDTRQQNRAWKQRAHRAFRRACKRAIWLELNAGQEMSHRFYHGGEYLA
jgi:hypothetical protein